MEVLDRCAWISITFSLLVISVSSCPSNIRVFNTGSTATLQYNINTLPGTTIYGTYRVIDPQSRAIVQFALWSGQIDSDVQTLNLTFTGNTSTGELSFRIDNVQTRDAGVYEMVRNADPDTPLLCNTVYITGSLSVPTLTSNNSPSIGESVILTCSSSSTTVPAGLPLVYTWQVDGASDPSDSRYTYSTSRDTLTISDVQKVDANKVFTCRAQEDGSQITSNSSYHFRINVLYGPENVRLEPSLSTYTGTENTTLAPITCRADCNPSCTMYTWTHLNSTWSTNTAVLDLGQLSRNEAGVYRCTVTRSAGYTSSIDKTVVVQFPPSSVTLAGNTSILANGINKVTLTCTASTANPPARISWSRNGQPMVIFNLVQETGGDYGGRITSMLLELTPTRDDDGDVFTCTASNKVNVMYPVISQHTSLDLVYSPSITITRYTPTDVTECTERLNLTCNVSSKPNSTITWFKGQHTLPTTEVNNVGQYSITNVDRTLSGLYKCVAYNGYGGNVQKTLAVSVKYAPDVSVMTRNATTHDQFVDIICNPSGVPGQYTFSPWIHQWDINGPVLNHPGLGNSPLLRLINLTYEHSGVYICTVSNGVDCSKNPDAGTGHNNLVIKAAPVLIYPQTHANTGRIRLATKVNQYAIFTFTFWSNADDTAAMCYRNINGTRQNTPVGSTCLTPTTVMLPVFDSTIATPGTLATLSLNIENTDDFGFYDIVVSNEIGEGTLLAITVVPQDTSTQNDSQINVGVVAGSIVGAIVIMIIVGLGFFLCIRIECTWKPKRGKQVDDVLIMKERSNVNETHNQEASPVHLYADVDEPITSSSSGQAAGTNEYEQAVSMSEPGHVYSELHQTR